MAPVTEGAAQPAAITALGLVVLAAALAAPAAGAGTPTDFIAVDGFERLEVMRIDSLELRDPHLFAGASFLCADITGALNASIADQLQAETEGVLDYSALLLFRDLRTDGRAGLGALGTGQCTAPAASTQCQAGGVPVLPLPYAGKPVGTCLAPVPGSVRPYSPAVTDATGPCFASAPVTLELAVGGLTLPLLDPRIGGSRRASPTPGIGNGLLYGFLTETAADAIQVELEQFGSVPLSSLLPGGGGNCASHSDKDLHNGEPGWWFHFNYAASQVPFQE